jgi:glutaredoxin
VARITLYTRRGCHLCEEAEQVVRAAAGDVHQVVLRDVDGDPALLDAYTVRVPVVEVDGVEVAQYQVDPAALHAALQCVT